MAEPGFEYSEDEAAYFGMTEDEMEGILTQPELISTPKKKSYKRRYKKESSDEESLEPLVIFSIFQKIKS